MHRVFVYGYCSASVIAAVLVAVFGILAMKKRNAVGYYLGLTAFSGVSIDLMYLGSVLARDELAASVFASFYFISFDWLLLALLAFTLHFTRRRYGKKEKCIFHILGTYAIFELAIFMINPFRNIAISYQLRNTVIAHYTYQMKPLYYCHLAYSYIMVALAIGMLLRKIFKTPRQYRNQYVYIVWGILAIVLFNALFLFLPDRGQLIKLLDISILPYCLIIMLMYWSCFKYTESDMLKELSMTVFGSIDQGLLLFDYDGFLVMRNARAEKLLPQVKFDRQMSAEGFIRQCGLGINLQTVANDYSLQCYVHREQEEIPLRCDFRRLKNARDDTIGMLFVFTDARLETDLMTGFQNWEDFQRVAREKPELYAEEATVVVADINGLTMVNNTEGKESGDQLIRNLAEQMKLWLPRDAYYIRGADAALIAICFHSGTEEIRTYMEHIKKEFQTSMQYALAHSMGGGETLVDTVKTAFRTMKTKKLLDRQSIHSRQLTSLVKALQECDSDTEAHVQRTQRMGELLGKRIGLTDEQQSDLSLLCLLHDIGKIGVPLEILNKPGKLTDEEWLVLQSHVEKGFQIAMSSQELSGIADMIRHHHERWDGKGYPDGLSRESIPLLSRIISVVDAYDAMVNTRTYRRAVTKEKAVNELKRCAGTQFDPYIVSEFLQMLAEVSDEELLQFETAGNEDLVVTESLDAKAPDIEETSGLAIHPVRYSRYLLNERYYIISVDERFAEMTGYTMDDITQRRMKQTDLIPEGERTDYFAIATGQMGKYGAAYIEHRLLKKDGSTGYVFCYGKQFYDSAAKETRVEVIISDSTNTYAVRTLMEEENSKARQRLAHWEMTYRRDSLTGLLVHAAFRNDIEGRLLQGDIGIMLLMMDVDHFKEYNDMRGHSAGDEFLILIAQTLQAALRRDDLACRMGGDEFAAAIFFDRGLDLGIVTERAQQIFDRLNLAVKGQEESAGISMGVTISVDDGRTFNQLYKDADEALYRSKADGRCRLTFAENR